MGLTPIRFSRDTSPHPCPSRRYSHGPRDTPALASGPTIQELLSRSANSRKVKAESDRLDHACVRWRHTLPNRLIKQVRRHIIIYSVASSTDDTLTRYQPSFTLSPSVGRCTVSRSTFGRLPPPIQRPTHHHRPTDQQNGRVPPSDDLQKEIQCPTCTIMVQYSALRGDTVPYMKAVRL